MSDGGCRILDVGFWIYVVGMWQFDNFPKGSLWLDNLQFPEGKPLARQFDNFPKGSLQLDNGRILEFGPPAGG
jgi:hypothetical protein